MTSKEYDTQRRERIASGYYVQRNKLITKQVISGEYAKNVADEHGLSPAYVSDIVKKVCWQSNSKIYRQLAVLNGLNPDYDEYASPSLHQLRINSIHFLDNIEGP